MPVVSYMFGFAGALAALAVTQKLCAIYDSRRFPAPGKIIAIPNGRMHVKQMGHGFPAVVLEAGIAASTLNWSLLQPLLAQKTATYIMTGRDSAGASQQSRMFAAGNSQQPPCNGHGA